MRHPCGNLPLSTISTHLHYCHHHQAWFGSLERWLQESDEVQVLGVRTVEFGPFDRLEDVLSWLGEVSRELLAAPGHPWAS